ncbi:PAS domain S-box protein [Leptospira broomii serovar Hurstbridge str. 5399]|uniref:histidine kinase n=1 Tax=Leptospira broomii serovar Hurstbridge str. 5399 TaxID=1049789 RepID=T0EWD1_9LEPT|nr:ATP-binding protein [Leptospira broomii]EQA43155.1 PAS domain S-box protein [Leptospira broomii serovar Hurstbridge str. 5399]
MNEATAKRIFEHGFSYIFDEIEDYAVIILDQDGFIQTWNIGAEKLKGYSATEIIGKNFSIFYPKQELQNGLPIDLLEQARLDGKARHEGWRVRKDGSKFYGNILITAIHDDNRDVVAFIKVTRDMTEARRSADILKRYNEELIAKNKEMEQFTYITSHDLRQPLNTIGSLLEILEKDFEKDFSEESRYFLKAIGASVERMKVLIKSLLDYSRIGVKRKLEMVDCNGLVHSVLEDLISPNDKRNVELHISALPSIRCYALELRLLFQNLIGNAIKYGRNSLKTTVSIEARKIDDGWEFSVQDNGIGIDSRYFDKIFSLFYRLHRDEEYEGIGIGLSHCAKIIELHKGKIWVESELGVGSKFIFYIPESIEI